MLILSPSLAPEDLTELCYWADPKFTSQDIADRARKARKVLDRMEAEGAVVLEKDGYSGCEFCSRE